jgi:hypothetical protein
VEPLTTHCASMERMHRRRWIEQMTVATSAAAMLSPWTQFAETIARADETSSKRRNKPRSLIFLWLQGGPSQLETFDPHPNTKIGGETQAIETSCANLLIADTLPKTAAWMHQSTLIRSMVSKEGDHERATYNMKTGWRPDPTLIHPSIGSVLCHQSTSNLEIPRHVSILSSQWPARGGYMGSQHDAFLVNDPLNPIDNLKDYLDTARSEQRLRDLDQVLEKEFRRGRLRNLDLDRTLHESSTRRARTMMNSDQVSAFDVGKESKSTRERFGDTPFGRGCLAAVRLIELGVRCVEIELGGWDTHARNYAFQSDRCKILDAALDGLLYELTERNLLDETIVVCGGEFGRTPQINIADGRDHWPTGFSTVVFGGPFRRGYAHGETTPEEPGSDPLRGVTAPVTIEDLHATILSTFEIPFEQELQTPIGRPLALSAGRVVKELLDI